MAWQLLNRAYTIGTIDVAQDITPGAAVTGFRDFTLLSSSNTTYIVGVQGSKWAYMKVSKVGSVLRPSTYIDGSNGIGATVTFDAGTITVFSDLGATKAVYEDGDGNAQNAESVLRTFSPETLAALKTTPLPSSGKTVVYLRNVATNDGKSAFYVWDPDETATGDDFSYVVSSLSATGRWVRQRVAGVIGRSYATLALLKAVGSEEFVQGELIELRGRSAEGDLPAGPVVGTWQASSTNTDALDKTFVRLDDTSGSNPGRVQFPYNINAKSPIAAIAISDGDATPDLSTGQVFKTANTAPTTITNFDGCIDGDEREVHFEDANTTIQHGANIKCKFATDIAGEQYDTAKFRLYSSVWRQL